MNLKEFENNTYTILWAYVRYRTDISDFEKILFAEIDLMTNRKGYCFASNKYFAKLFNKTAQHISRSISNLKKANLIDIVTDKETNTRKIYIHRRRIEEKEQDQNEPKINIKQLFESIYLKK